MNSGLSNKMNKNRIIGVLLLIIICGAGFFLFKNFAKAEGEILQSKMDFAPSTTSADIKLKNFDPNSLDKNGWISIGFSEKEANTILNWKDVLGGNFSNKEQLKKCYAISDEKYSQIESYILLPENKTKNYQNNKYPQYSPQAYTPKNQVKVSKKFNPDLYSANDWQNLGFSERQAESIVKYKNYLGGSFISKEKLKECYMISPENYAKLEPYLLLPETSATSSAYNSNSKTKNSTKQTINYSAFNPNELGVEGWMNLGFSEKQAMVIVNYRDKNLRGSFKNLEEIKKCFVISEEKFEEIKPYIILKEVVADSNTPKSETVRSEKSNINFANIDLNEISADQLQDFGFDKRAANGFVSFRKNLGGFVDKNQIYETYGIDRELAEKLVNIAPLNSNKVPKYTLSNAPESWLKTHPYFKYSADKIIYYRISNPDDKKIWKFLQSKPEYEAKMRMYLNN